MKKSPLQFAKKTVNTSLNIAGRLQKTASVAGLSALRIAKGEKPDAHLLKETFMQLGVTYIKLGQFIASTPSLFPKDYVNAFAECLDKTPPLPFEMILGVLQDELGDTDDIFSHIDPTPLASASIAQVHKAVLKDGRVVALKVQKPNVGTIIQTDLGVLYGTFWTLEKLMPSMKAVNLAPIMAEIKERMYAETDFVAESANIEHFHRFLEQTGNQKITAPTVHHNLSTKKVLVMDFLQGKSLIDVDFNDMTAQRVMNDVLDTWFLSVVMTGKFHADLHAGNVMWLDDGKVAFLDFGLVGNIDPKSLQSCFYLVQALQAGDYQGMAQAMAGIGMTHVKVDTKCLASDLQTLLSNQRHDTDNLNAFMLELGDIGKRHGIHFPKDFALLTKQMLYFDRFMVALAPDMDLFGGERMKVVQALQ
ncbi:ABC1 kinase family protein [Moraxella oblonga]|uniref:ABC1 kinase family protein n=1 Tax=Moraxella oblonga TaxID=200413 RepID=UPI000835B305|nr:AarF/ABC1/UbiB kinase family protein [Moraxella oblonga]